MASSGPRPAPEQGKAVGPLIGLACTRVGGQPGRARPQGMSEPYLKAVIDAGADPVLIPMALPPASLARVVRRLDGVLLVGGGDVGPSWYGAERHEQCGEADEERDRSEIALVHEVLAQGKPLLAICRGIQVLNVALGGTLYQHIPSDIPDSTVIHGSPERQALVHSVRLAPSSRLAQVVGQEEIWVNSMHHQAVRDVAGALLPVAWAPDGLVEAVEMPAGPLVLGVQWHPEELIALESHARQIFSALAMAARDHQSRL